MSKGKQKKQLTKKQTIFTVIGTILLMGGLYLFIHYITAKQANWQYMQSFADNRYLTCVEKTYSKKKSRVTRRYFFLISGYDFMTNQKLEPFEVTIDRSASANSEYLGFSKHYIWLTTPKMTAVDMRTVPYKVIAFTELSQMISAKNPGLFREVTELQEGGGYLIATNQDGDAYYIQLTTFKAMKESPSVSESEKEFIIYSALPGTTNYEPFYEQESFEMSDGISEVALKPLDEMNPFRFSLYRLATGKKEITVTASDTLNAGMTINGEQVQGIVSQENPVEQERLSNSIFINAKTIGLVGNRFVFYCQKQNTPPSPWFLIWFDTDQRKVVKEMDLSKKGMEYKEATGYLRHGVSVDEKYVFFAMPGRVPLRIAL